MEFGALVWDGSLSDDDTFSWRGSLVDVGTLFGNG
jgi:hypothetical protein